MVRVGINGFGRVGRCVFRSAYEHGLDIDWVGINDLADAHTLSQLLRRDTVYGPFPDEVRADDDTLVVGETRIPVFGAGAPGVIPWGEIRAEVVLECTGRFRTRDAAAAHLEAGVRKVIVSAPPKGADATIVLGVNEDAYDPASHHVVSNASCTTNCLAPVAKVLHERIGIRHGVMTTVHAYTGRGREHVRTSTGAAKAIGLVIPQLAGRLQGFALRVPVLTGSLVDLTVEVERPTSVSEVNEAFADAAQSAQLGGILGYSDEPLVSSDVVKSGFSSVFDAALTTVVGETQVKVVAWYDNEWRYSTRLAELAQRVLVPVAPLL